MENIQSHLSMSKVIVPSHVIRFANKVAYKIANKGVLKAQQQLDTCWEIPPILSSTQTVSPLRKLT
jgi:hypothetical protein